MIENILVIVDPTAASHPCIEKAARIALGFGSTLDLFICDVEQGGGAAFADYRQKLRERRLSMLEALAAPLRAQGIHVKTDSQWHVPLESAPHLADEVVSAQERTAARERQRTEVEQTDCDLLAVKPSGFVSPALVARD